MKNEMMFFDSATKFDRDGVILRRAISFALSKAKPEGDILLYPWTYPAKDLTYGQAKKLAESNCALVMVDDKGRQYYQVPSANNSVVRMYVPTPEVV